MYLRTNKLTASGHRAIQVTAQTLVLRMVTLDDHSEAGPSAPKRGRGKGKGQGKGRGKVNPMSD